MEHKFVAVYEGSTTKVFSEISSKPNSIYISYNLRIQIRDLTDSFGETNGHGGKHALSAPQNHKYHRLRPRPLMSLHLRQTKLFPRFSNYSRLRLWEFCDASLLHNYILALALCTVIRAASTYNLRFPYWICILLFGCVYVRVLWLTLLSEMARSV